MIADVEKVKGVTYTLNPKVEKDLMGLHQYGFSKFPGSYEFRGVSLDGRTGKFVTGLDEFAAKVLTIADPTERKKEQDRIIKVRTELEAKFGQPGLLSPKSEYWISFGIPIATDESGHAKIDGAEKFDPINNPTHELYLIVAKANNMFAFSSDDSYSPDFRNDRFYLTTDEEVMTEGRLSNKLKRERAVRMSELFDGEKQDYNRAWAIAYYIGLKPRVNTSVEKLEEELEKATTVGDKLEIFLSTCKIPNDELIIANTVKKAIALGIIKMHPVDKVLYRGGANFRPTEQETIEYLSTPSMLTELSAIIDAVKKVEANRKNVA